MNNENTNSRREILAGMGLATLGMLGLSAAWQKLGGATAVTSNYDARDTSFPNVTLYTHEGEAVRFYDDLIRDKVVAINMMYSDCAGICPVATANLLRVQQMLGDRVGRDVFMYSITLQPELDTPKGLKHYADRHGIKTGWKFLTGAPEDIELVRYRLGFYDRDENIDNIKENHTGMIRIGNDTLNRWSMAPALAEPQQIMATINHLDPKAVHTHENLA
ncbi:SCO family protein [Nitrosomonas sp. JL21]|uniref:SCO family protein n=1 Tax=Nitrosomonas sp. JL21 TaxID=153949 RepID=UPI0013711029|nr:SCO family protein [Nitrosomonas sp. JL21]MBL8498615.1 SCO family protein [Nitrosomonas sp.]MCC7090433.1 SCO family protein [Nitrosomonas sp.]MXS77286.1 SCO family protein [Nitrosomonas sp. JL21]